MYKHNGFSLLELVLVLFLISLIFAFGLPLHSHWHQTQVAWVMQTDIEQAMEQGMQESLVLGEPLRLVPMQGEDWSFGMALVRETDIGKRPLAYLYTWPWQQRVWHMTWHGFLSQTFLRFTPDISQLSLNGYFFLEQDHAENITILVNRMGRMRIKKI